MKTSVLAFRLLAVMSFALGVVPAAAQSYPAKPIRLIAPNTPGSATDIRARWIASLLGPAIGQSVVVENRGGAGGTIGTEAGARSAPDGYTILLVHQGTIALSPFMYPKLGYDSIADFSPITRISMNPFMLAVNAQVPAETVADLIRLAKEKPGLLNFGSPGNGTPPHLAAELFKNLAKIDVVHIPYKGGGAALTDLVSGRLAFTFDSLAVQMAQVKAGKIKSLGITSARRVGSLPDVPTLAESGLPGYEYWSWMGISAPAKTPREIVARLNAELVKVLATREARDWLTAQGADPGNDTPEAFAAFIKSELTRWGPIIREAGLKPD